MVASVQVLPLATGDFPDDDGRHLRRSTVGCDTRRARERGALVCDLGRLRRCALIVRPGSAGFEWAMLLALGSALSNGLRDLV
jgi:hypothetical protein